MNRRIFLVLALSLGALLAGCSAVASSGARRPDASDSAGSANQVEEAGGITLTATWENPGQGLTFHIQLDNHAVDLDTVTLQGASLRNEHGETLSAPPWDAAAGGGHHRDGWLKFDGDAAAFLRGVSWIELTLPPIGTVTEPPVRWTVGSTS